jgi:hypothetical protein
VEDQRTTIFVQPVLSRVLVNSYSAADVVTQLTLLPHLQGISCGFPDIWYTRLERHSVGGCIYIGLGCSHTWRDFCRSETALVERRRRLSGQSRVNWCDFDV